MFERRCECNSFAIPLRSHVCQILGFAGVHDHIGRACVFADNHARINIFLRSDEKGASFLQVIEGVGHGGSCLQGNEYTVDPARDFATESAVFAEKVGNNAHTFGQILEIGLKADQTASRNGSHQGSVVAVGLHVLDFGFSTCEIAHDIPQREGRNFRI